MKKTTSYAHYGDLIERISDILLQVRCSLETMWVCWDFVDWLGEQQAKDVFTVELKNYATRDDTVHQIKLARSTTEHKSEGLAG